MTDKLVWVDCEMTGLDASKDRLLEVALILTDVDLNQASYSLFYFLFWINIRVFSIQLDSIDSLYISTPKKVLDEMPEWHQKHFTENGLIKQCLNSNLTLEQVDSKLSDFMIKNNIKKGILAGNSIATDREFLNKYCPLFVSHLHYRMVDVSSIKVLISSWYHDVTFYNKQTEHRALSDITQSIDELKYYKKNYFKNK